jgi:hypothetical protein
MATKILHIFYSPDDTTPDTICRQCWTDLRTAKPYQVVEAPSRSTCQECGATNQTLGQVAVTHLFR